MRWYTGKEHGINIYTNIYNRVKRIDAMLCNPELVTYIRYAKHFDQLEITQMDHLGIIIDIRREVMYNRETPRRDYIEKNNIGL